MEGLWSGGPMAEADVLDLAGSMLPAHEPTHPRSSPRCAPWPAAGITPAQAVIVGGFTDFVDTVRAVVGRSPRHGDGGRLHVGHRP